MTTILRQVHQELSTRKVLLVGHSQGTFYTNAAYDYLTGHGVAKESIAVYNIATPADRVLGGGNYLTSSTDKVISSIVAGLASVSSVRKPLPANIDLALSADEQNSSTGGHSLGGVYLTSAPDRVVADMQGEINSLSATDSLNQDCFTPPPVTLSNTLEGFGLKTADFGLAVLKNVKTSVDSARVAIGNWEKQVAVAGAQALGNALVYISNLQASLFGRNPFVAALTGNLTKNLASDTQVDALANQTSKTQDIVDFAENKSSADVLVQSNQDQIDDILERIDVLRRQLADVNKSTVDDTQIILADKKVVAVDVFQQKTETTNNISTIVRNMGSGTPFYPKILISEVQTASATDDKQEFVELYNPTADQVSLTGWYLQRKTKTGTSFSSFVTSTLFNSEKIGAKDYLVIARQGSGFLGDIIIDNPLTDDNSLVLKNPSGDISDMLGWGLAQSYEGAPAQNPPGGRSVGRKFVDGSEVDINNNSLDFELASPTPRVQNVAYVAPILVVPTDTVAPTVVFNDLASIQSNLTFTINLTITDTALDTVLPSGIAGYTLRARENEGNWQEDLYKPVTGALLTFSDTKNITGNDETKYSFQVKTKDIAGNESDWQPETPASTKISIFKKILINEVQTAGVTTKDEFIELYNPNTVGVNMAGFALKKKTSGGTESNLISTGSFLGVIKSQGYFLIAPPNNEDGSKNYTGVAMPDLYYSGKTFSIASSNTVLLYNADGALLDKVGFGAAKDFELLATVNPDSNKSIERKKPGQDTDNNANDFKVSDAPTPKGAFPKTILQDVTDYSQNFGINVPGAPTLSLLIKWSSPSANISSYQVQQKMGDADWVDWLASTAQTQESVVVPFSLITNNSYIFRARATDNDGNVGDWSEQITINLANPVIINEVNTGAFGQWIELYNKSDNDVNLDGWKIVSGALNLSLKGTILSHGYFILEANDDDTLPDVLADQIFTTPLGQALYLRGSNNRYMDEFGGFSQAGGEASVERISPYSFGSLAKNWQVNNGAPVVGTYGAQNSSYQRYTYIEASFIQNTTLTKALSPYLFLGGNVQVPEGVTLTIEPGVVIKFFDTMSNFIINGTLRAVGTSDQKIIFTSLKDDEFGGDTNQNGSDTAPIPGNWLGIYFSPSSTNSTLEHVRVRYAGAQLGSSPPGWGNAIWVDYANISLKNSIIEQNKNIGLRLVNSLSMVDFATFLYQDTENDVQYKSRAVYVLGGAPTVKNSDFENNTYGIYIDQLAASPAGDAAPSTPVIENNTFENNNTPIYVGTLSYPFFTNNKAENNTYNTITFNGDIVQNMTLSPDLPYLIRRILTVPENITLTLQPGVIMNFYDNSAGIKTEGTLTAVGTPDAPIIFRAFHYDQPWVLPGNWLGLQFSKTSVSSVLEYVGISYAGAFYGSDQNPEFAAAINVDQSIITLKNSLLQNNANSAMRLVNSASLVDGVRFVLHNVRTAVLPPKAVHVRGGSPTIKNSSFEKNTFGIYQETWHNPDTGEDVLPTPDYSDNNTFADSELENIFPTILPVAP